MAQRAACTSRFAGFVDKFFGHFRPEIPYGALPRGSQNSYKMLPIYSSSIWHKALNPPRRAVIYNLTESPTAKSLTGILQRIRSAPQTQLSKVWLKTWKRFYIARGNRQIARIPRAFACISVGAPWWWGSVMQIFPGTRATAHAHCAISQNIFFHLKFKVLGWLCEWELNTNQKIQAVQSPWPLPESVVLVL